MPGSWRYLPLLTVTLISVACEPLPEADAGRESRPPGTPGTVPVELLDDSLSVPAGWGDLVAIHPLDDYPAMSLIIRRPQSGIQHAGVVVL